MTNQNHQSNPNESGEKLTPETKKTGDKLNWENIKIDLTQIKKMAGETPPKETLEEKEEKQALEKENLPAKETETKPKIELHLLQVLLKSEGDKLLLILPGETETQTQLTWEEIREQINIRINAGERFWPAQIPLNLIAKDRLLDARQIQEIATILNTVQIQLQLIDTNRRSTAVAAATAGYSVAQIAPFSNFKFTENTNKILADPLYLETTLRSGMEINHPGTVVILGDVNPGAKIVAAGDILIWGKLRGFAHSGSLGNVQCVIMALLMAPTQLRIAHYIARAPDDSPTQYDPEVAYITPEGIRIAKAADFHKKLENN
ncbi:MAG TPA: septum site-determining protein MinC [Allocoleopsis sp.]